MRQRGGGIILLARCGVGENFFHTLFSSENIIQNTLITFIIVIIMFSSFIDEILVDFQNILLFILSLYFILLS